MFVVWLFVFYLLFVACFNSVASYFISLFDLFVYLLIGICGLILLRLLIFYGCLYLLRCVALCFVLRVFLRVWPIVIYVGFLFGFMLFVSVLVRFV